MLVIQGVVMLKRMLVGLVLVCGFGIGAIDSFAFDTAKNLEKEAQLEAKKEIKKEIKKEAEAKLETTTKDTKSEPHFDLPKKDAKEQCAEVERVVKECSNNISKNGKMYKCGNFYISSFYFYPLHDLSYGGLEPYLIMDQFGNYIASNIADKVTFVSKHKDNKIFETKDNDLKISTKKNVTVFYNQNCTFTKINFYY